MIIGRDKIGIIIPSFNESESIGKLINIIFKNNPRVKIFIVDDSPPDENQKIKKLENTNIKIISRLSKQGRGSAVIKGFNEALKLKNILYLFEMDADLSHDPKEFSLFLSKINEDRSDVVIGSRYIKGGKTKDWPKWRLILSRCINFSLNILLGMNLTDYTNGFRLYNRKAAQFLVKSNFRTSGFILLSESSYKLKLNGFIISEVPIHFTDRKFGQSSMGLRELFSSLYNILLIRFTTKN